MKRSGFMNVILIVCDGMSDRPVKKGKTWKTPLQIARTSNMDRIAREGICGISDPIAPGIVPGSDTAHFALFGYDPYKYYTGRGVLEALGSNIRLYENDVALRTNFATVDGRMNILDRRAGRIDGNDAEGLAKAIEHIKIRNIHFYFKHTVGHRGVLIIRNKVSPLITATDPHELAKVMKSQPITEAEIARKTAEALNDWTTKTYEILNRHPINVKRKKAGLPVANIVIGRGASTTVRIPRFEDRFDLKGVCIAKGTLYKGIARYVGMDTMDVKGATGNLKTDIAAKVAAVKKSLKNYQFFYLHIKGCDVASHDGDAAAKIKFIERIDKAIKPLLALKDTIIILTADHSTPVSLKNHSADPVPVAIRGEGVRPDNIKKYDEISVAQGGLNRITQHRIMSIVVNLLGKAKMFGT